MRKRDSGLGETSHPMAGNEGVQRKGRKEEEKICKEIQKQEIAD
jgi:hypothetical protein